MTPDTTPDTITVEIDGDEHTYHHEDEDTGIDSELWHELSDVAPLWFRLTDSRGSDLFAPIGETTEIGEHDGNHAYKAETTVRVPSSGRIRRGYNLWYFNDAELVTPDVVAAETGGFGGGC